MDRMLRQAPTILITGARATGSAFLPGFVPFLTWDTEGRGKGVGFAAPALSRGLAEDPLS